MSLFKFIFLHSYSHSHVKQIKGSYFQYLLFFIFIYLTVDGVSSIESMDLGRYIEDAILSSNISWIKIIQDRLSERGDFLYYIITATSAKFSISIKLVTSFIVFIYYLLVINCVKLNCSNKIEKYILLCVILTTPIVWVVSISRNLTAIMFLYCAFYYFMHKKKRLAFFFMLLGVLTHFTTIIWVLLFIGCYFFQNIHVRTKVMFFLLTLFLVLGRFMPLQLQKWIMLFFEGKDFRYSSYDLNEAIGIFSSTYDITIGDRLSPVFALVYSCFLLLYNKKQGLSFWYLFMLTVLLAYFLNSSITFVNRIMMFIPLFWGLNVVAVYSENMKCRNKLKLISCIGILFFLLNIYTYRYVYTLL